MTVPDGRHDERSTSELIERALADAASEDEGPESYRALVALHERGTRDVLEAALALCRSPDAAQRVLATDILGELGAHERTFPAESCDALRDLLQHDTEEQVVASAAFALGHLGNRAAEGDLIALRAHPNELIRHGIAFALCGTTTEAGIRALLHLVDDPDAQVRDWAITGLGRTEAIDGPEIRAALLRRIDDPDELVRAEALHGLARRHDARAVPGLVAALSSRSYRIDLFVEAAQAYLGLGEDDETDPPDLIRMLERSER